MLIFSNVLRLSCFIGLSVFVIIWANKNKGEGYIRAIIGSILFAIGGILFAISAITISFPLNAYYRILATAGIILIITGWIFPFKYLRYLKKSKNKAKP
jgi:hypothetical protein